MSIVERLRSWLRTAAREHWLPLLILVIPINVAVGVWTHAPAFLFVLIVPVAAFLVGMLLRPPHVWLIWLGSIVIVWISMGLWGRYNDPEDETVLSLMLEAIVETLVGVALPLWLGRLVGSANTGQNRRMHGPGGTPSSPETG